MGRIFLILLLLFAGMLLFRLLGRSGRGDSDAPRKGPLAERMVACKLCGLNVPESDGVRYEGAFYCCEEHRRRAAEGEPRR